MTFLAIPAAFFPFCGSYKKANITNDLLGVLFTFQEVKGLETTKPKSMEK